MKAKHTGHLYQLSSRKPLHVGAYVAINGPWDTYGVILSSTHQPKDNNWLNSIRGVAARPGDKPVYNF